MSLVERLAAKQAEHFAVPMSGNRRADAIWWLNAIAEELEAEDAKFSNDTPYAQIARWIQANSEGP